jgi:murein DD-endopeptidase MepM/ murein hydrolase activator NlpD
MIENAGYYLPFDTFKNPIRISQGRNGPWSHFLIKREAPAMPGSFIETDLINAVDFALPVGTPVLAAREGRVLDYWLWSDWCYEGLDPKIGNNVPRGSTNYLVIKHNDDTYAWYSHLGNQALVERNQIVLPGTVIGVTGKSGWIAEIPHLHFHINQGRSTIPVDFVNYQGSLDHQTLLREGKIWFGE